MVERDVKEMNFEESLTALEGLVGELEAGGLDLDKVLEVYARAVELRDRCREILEESERKVQKLIEGNGVKDL
ncbi:MAG: exodeoxyribonuclease VII small subunit [Thermoplasmatales archaeon]|nr:exodeoxyribonuclease VII small subunit [Thermoplasmatales archaeon]